LGGVPGVPPADVAILGGGVAGSHAALISAGMGATVTVIDRNPDVLRRVSTQLGARVRTVFSTSDAIETLCRRADLVIASVLIPGAAAPKLITADTVKAMKPGSVIVDLAAEQGGNCALTEPGQEVVRHGVTIMGPTNLPSTMPFHASQMYARTVTSFLAHLLRDGTVQVELDDDLTRGPLVTHRGEVVHPAVKAALGP
ncbi:MAG: NAD(P)-dependent oxidoreductase, partial [Actinomycetota bacterium]